MRVDLRVTVRRGPESVQSVNGFFRCFSRHAMQETGLVEMRGKQRGLPRINCFLNVTIEVSIKASKLR